MRDGAFHRHREANVRERPRPFGHELGDLNLLLKGKHLGVGLVGLSRKGARCSKHKNCETHQHPQSRCRRAANQNFHP
jgi:hypothetical protein